MDIPAIGAERRSEARVAQRGLAVIQVAGRRLGGFVVNLSSGGVFISCNDTLQVGTPCEVRLWMNEGSRLSSLSLQGDICRRTQDGVGIRFVGPEAIQGVLSTIVERQQAVSTP